MDVKSNLSFQFQLLMPTKSKNNITMHKLAQ